MTDTRLAIDYLGHATLLVELDGIRFLTDPALRDRIGPLVRIGPSIEARATTRVDAVLVSHLHHDHLDLPSLDQIGPDVRVVAPPGAGAWLRARGVVDVTELGHGEAVSIGGVRIRAVPARHSGGRPFGAPRSGAVGYVLEGSRSVYFAGDTGFFRGLADLAGAVDVALLPVGGWGPTLRASEHLDPVAAARAAALIRPRVAVPIHWGTYWPSGLGWLRRARQTGPAIEFARVAAELAPAVRVRATVGGETVELA
jgi:L-ascorbate metabolism protein UlaG (beta-lactamase superfamily)